jgi:8-oxo-dGTP diphosphatase
MNDKSKFCYPYPRPAFTVDAAVVCNNEILLIQRKNNPYQGQWALPGGFMDMGETPEDAVLRELFEETNIKLEELMQFKTYGAIHRDPRHRTISTVFYTVLPKKPESKAGDDAADVAWFPLDKLPHLAFDHDQIIRELEIAMAKKRG